MRAADAPLPADARADAHRPILSLQARVELVAAVSVIVFCGSIAPRIAPAIEAWIQAHAIAVQTSALAKCRPPAEFEQVHVVVENRAGTLAVLPCMYVGSKGTYAR